MPSNVLYHASLTENSANKIKKNHQIIHKNSKINKIKLVSKENNKNINENN